MTSPNELFHINGGALNIGNTASTTDRTVNLLKFGDGNHVQMGEWGADDLLSFKENRYNCEGGTTEERHCEERSDEANENNL
ncbi:MAG: hypothetical protein LBE13_13275 [Bacteroidales bacterium]|nr:hypothetical protein [Bacteroidales bacterium]